MKKSIFILLAIGFLMTGCTSKSPAAYTLLGDYTPYWHAPERLIGEVEKLIEKNYWAVPTGDTFKKGNLITIKERDSLGWTDDFEATFDKTGESVIIKYLDEYNKSFYQWEMVKENNILVTAKEILNDTIRGYQKFKYNTKGEIIEFSAYNSNTDTLLYSSSIKSNIKKDTITRQFFNKEGILFLKYIYLYNDEGQFLRRDSYNKEGEFLYANEVKYNGRGKISDLIFYDKDKKVSAVLNYTYEYDNMGNWIKAIVKDKMGTVVFEERVYTYFE